jgi:S-adenosylmethionine:tRNA ribosyltransferase-isomerase
MRVSDFDFTLPPDRIALRPAVPRESAKLLQVAAVLKDHTIADLPKLLRAGDVLVFNDTKVIPASLLGKRISSRTGTEAKIEILLHQRLQERVWSCFAKPAKKLEVADRLVFGFLEANVILKDEGSGEVTIEFDMAEPSFWDALQAIGEVPLPPYIKSKRKPDQQDTSDYQSIFAENPGAVAAPTASLHFTPDLLKRLQNAGITTETVTLHVGAGTFQPVKTADTKDHRMHAEWGEISVATAARLRAAKEDGCRIIAVGTTSLRLLEASGLEPFSDATDIFITPGYQFRTVDGLITNFHLPKSTLFMLVSAFSGLDRMQKAYAHAINKDYRFYSYGDACLLWPST